MPRRRDEHYAERRAADLARYQTSEKGIATRRAYLAKPEGREAVRRSVRTYHERHAEYIRERGRIGRAVRTAVEDGRLVREPCAECGHPKAEAHHHNGYERDHWLDVTWLCRVDHRAAHGRPVSR